MAKRFVKAWLLAAYVTAEHNELLLARAATIDVFFKNATAPNTWTVRSREDIDGPHTDIYNKSKHVYRAHVQGKRVVVQIWRLERLVVGKQRAVFRNGVYGSITGRARDT